MTSGKKILQNWANYNLTAEDGHICEKKKWIAKLDYDKSSEII